MNVGLCGEVRAVVVRSDGSVKVDTGYMSNVITNFGLDFIGRGGINNSSGNMLTFCAVGTGNSQPLASNVKLDNPISSATRENVVANIDYNKDKDKDLYKVYATGFYRFYNLKDVNIAEVGLLDGPDITNNVYTRTLIKDGNGNSTTITVLDGEILELYYRLWQVHDLTDVTGVIEADIDGVKVPYNYVIRRAGVGGVNLGGSWGYGGSVGTVYWGTGNNSYPVTCLTGDIGGVTSTPSGRSYGVRNYKYGRSTAGTYEATISVSISITDANDKIRSLLVITSLGAFQIRFGTVDGDLPIDKTVKDTLSFEFVVSWGRYTGDL